VIVFFWDWYYIEIEAYEAIGEQRDGAVRVGAAEELRDHRNLPQQIPTHLQK
jgi:hypothetical protein